MRTGILKRFCAVSAAAVLMFSISGCASTSTTDGAKSLSNASSDYNIADYNDESVKIELETGMAFSEKGVVRFEGNGSMTNLIDFWEYGKEKSDTVYFENPAVNLLNESYYTNQVIEFAFEYKDMIYFLKRTYEKSNFVYTLYRMNLKGDNITKVSSISFKNNYANESYDACEYEITDVYVQNNSLMFSIYSYELYYEDYYDGITDEDYEDDEFYYENGNIEYVYRIDLTSGISNELLNDQNFSLSNVKCDNDFTYLYVGGSSKEDFKVYKIDNKTNKSEVIQYNLSDSNAAHYNIVDVYSYTDVIDVNSDVLICHDDYNINLVSVNKKPETIFEAPENFSIYNAWLIDDNLIIQLENETTYKLRYYTYNFNKENEPLNESYAGEDINKAIYKLGDKYLCLVPDSDYYSADFYENEKCEYYYWSSIDDVEANKHNFGKIKNQRKLDSFDYPLL